jgi:hypothetical protein
MPSQADYERRIQRAQQQLKDELTEAGLKIHQARAAKQEASSWSSMQSQAKMEQDNKDLQDFLMRRRSQHHAEETHQSPAASASRRSGLFM